MKFILFLALVLLTDPGAAETTLKTYSFKEFWTLVRGAAPQIEAANQDLAAARARADLTRRHWLPRVYADVRAFSSNDPSQVFMGKLNQRKIGPLDLSPDSINHPAAQTFERAALGFDLAIYEGGAGSAGQKIGSSEKRAKEWELRATRVGTYAETANAYSDLVALSRQREELGELLSRTLEILKTYQIGTKSNPIGYSGMLGLKSFKNRIEGLLQQNEARQLAIHSQLTRLAALEQSKWRPGEQDVLSLLGEVVTSASQSQTEVADSPTVHAAQEYATTAAGQVALAQAPLRPRVGVFGEAYAFHGDRTTGRGETLGAYLQWNLISPADWGSAQVARANSLAAQARLQMKKLEVTNHQVQAAAAIAALKANLGLMKESSLLLREQTATAHRLFHAGTISALQLAEVLARNADLIVERVNAEMALAEQTQLLLLSLPYRGDLYE